MTDREILQLIADKVINMEGDISTLKTDVSSLKSDVSTIKEEQVFMKRAIFEISERTITTEEKMDSLTKQVSRNTDQLAGMRTIHHKVKDHDTDIRLIKKMLIQ